MIECLITNTVTGEYWQPDASAKITLGITAKPSEHPVESGAAITDHVQVLAQTLSIECVVTESPTTPGSDYGASRVQRFQKFVQSLATGQPATIVDFRHGTLENMVLTSGPIPIDSTRNVRTTLEFQQVRIVSATLTTLGATASQSAITEATTTSPPATSDLSTELAVALGGANITVAQNLAAQPTTATTASTKQQSVAYVLAHAAGLV